jgi:hypothetical protein
LLARLPLLAGEPIGLRWRYGLRAWRGKLRSGEGPGQEVHAASYPRKRILILDHELKKSRVEMARIVTHELFHFVWIRLGNNDRWGWWRVLEAELREGGKGDLGWSAEWRRDLLSLKDRREHSRRWRDFACESFCDTAAWLYCGFSRHPEYTLPSRLRTARRNWFRELLRRNPAGLRA